MCRNTTELLRTVGLLLTVENVPEYHRMLMTVGLLMAVEGSAGIPLSVKDC